MFKYLLTVITLLIMLGCSSSPNNIKSSSINNTEHSTQVTLSHVKAYLLIGNIQKAEQLFQTIETPELNAQAMLALAELQAAKGSSVDAQKTFLLALTDTQYDTPLNKEQVSVGLLDYFCAEKKWPALEGYASALDANAVDETQLLSPSSIQLKNSALTQIGWCFFNGQHFEQAQKWLQQLDMTQPLDPQVHLALARIAVEQNKKSVAQKAINQYEATKTTIDAKILWTAFEVYMALEQPEVANQLGEYLRSFFPNNEYTRNYIIAVKRGERAMRRQQAATALLETNNLAPEPSSPEQSFHIIKKGETLYQLSKRYGVTIPELQAWNPSLVIDDISVGTKIQVTRSR